MSVSNVLDRLRAYSRYRETVRQLSALTDRQLQDLGLSRHDIRRRARAAQAA